MYIHAQTLWYMILWRNLPFNWWMQQLQLFLTLIIISNIFFNNTIIVIYIFSGTIVSFVNPSGSTIVYYNKTESHYIKHKGWDKISAVKVTKVEDWSSFQGFLCLEILFKSRVRRIICPRNFWISWEQLQESKSVGVALHGSQFQVKRKV